MLPIPTAKQMIAITAEGCHTISLPRRSPATNAAAAITANARRNFDNLFM
jgi:hypothetical protein